MTPGERVKKLRESLGLTQSQLGDILGFKWTKIKDIEIGKQKLTPEIALVLEKNFSFSFKWLLIGEGKMMFNRAGQDIDTVVSSAQPPLDPQQQILHSQLQRILDAGNLANIEAMKGILNAFDPGLKNDGRTNEDERARVAGNNAA